MESIKDTLKKADLIGDTAPEELSGVKTFDPKVDKPINIMKDYTSKDFLMCSCGARQRHKVGLVVEFDNGNLGLVGKNCAEEYFGQDYTVLVRQKEAKQATQIFKSLIKPCLQEIEAMRGQMGELRVKAQAKDKFFAGLASVAPDVFRKLELSRKEMGKWLGSNSRDGRFKDTRDGKIKMYWGNLSVTLAVIDGYGAISRSSQSLVNKIDSYLKRAEEHFRQEPYADKNIATALRFMEAVRPEVKKLEEEISSAQRFFTRHNLSAVCAAITNDEDLYAQKAALTKNKMRIFTDLSSEHVDPDNAYIEVPIVFGFH